MTYHPRITIVTNALNQGAFLDRCIRSVLSQRYPKLRYVVIDPGSTDNTQEILGKYSGSLEVVKRKDCGPGDGMNRVLLESEGEIFGYLNADDAYLPNALSEVGNAWGQLRNTAAIAGSGYVVDIEGKVQRKIASTPFTLSRFRKGNFLLLQQATFYNASAFRQVGGFNAGNRTSWDLELLVDFLLAGFQVKAKASAWGIFSIYPTSITGSQRLKSESLSNHLRVFEKAFGRAPYAFERTLRPAYGKLAKFQDIQSFLTLAQRPFLRSNLFPELQIRHE